MRSFDYGKLKNKKWDNEIVGYVTQIHEHKVKQESFLRQKPNAFETLVEIAKIQSTEASNAIEGIRTTDTRLRRLMFDKTSPKNRDEEDIKGYKDVLNIIHESYEFIPLTPNYVLQLHKTLYSHSAKDIGGKYKNVQNYISAVGSDGKAYNSFTPLAPYETATAVENICDEFNKAIADCEVDSLILIPVFIHDFLCIHPFLDGNGRMSRLLTTLLLYKCGYTVGKYISLKAKISKTKDSYYQALEKSQQGWHDGNDNPETFIKYFLGTVISAYRDLEERTNVVIDNLPAIETVKKAIGTVIGKFNKAELTGLCPTVGVKSIESALKKLIDDGSIEKHGTGKNTFYTRKNI